MINNQSALSTQQLYNKRWTDLDPEMEQSWDKDVAVVKGLTSIHYSLLGIITTRKGSRPFMPDFGCDVGNMLFDNWSPALETKIKKAIQTSVAAFEPRVILNDVGVVYQEENSIQITVYFAIKEIPDVIQQPLSVTIASSTSAQ